MTKEEKQNMERSLLSLILQDAVDGSPVRIVWDANAHGVIARGTNAKGERTIIMSASDMIDTALS